MWSLEDGQGIAASQYPPGTPLPKRRREPTRCSSGPGNHPGKRFPVHLSATPDNCLGWSPASVSRTRDTAARRFLRRYRSLRRRSQRMRPYTRSTGRLAKSGREQSSLRSGPKIWVLSAHRPAETRTPSYPTAPRLTSSVLPSGETSSRRPIPGSVFSSRTGPFPGHRTFHNAEALSDGGDRPDKLRSVRRPKHTPQPPAPTAAAPADRVPGATRLPLNPTSRRVSSGASVSVWTMVGGPAVPTSFPCRSKIVTCDRPAVPGRQATTPVRETEKCAT